MAWCEGGDPLGLPVLVVHGGPGGRTRWPSLQWWQDLPVRWIAYDQRGCGRSQPRAGLAGNDLPRLLDDIECLRVHLAVSRWALAAGSWGSLLAVAYAARYPEVVTGLFLRSSFSGSLPELQRYMAPWSDWLGDAGWRTFGPRAQALQRWLCHDETALCDAGSLNVTFDALAEDPVLAQAWAAFDAGQSGPGGVLAARTHWQPSAAASTPSADALCDWRLFLHWARQGWGVGPHGVVPVAGPMQGPVWLVHGEADAVCDPSTSAQLAARWPTARWVQVPEGAHAMSHPPMAAALQEAAAEWVQALDEGR